MATFCAFHSHLNNPTFPPGQVGASDQDLQCPQAPNSWNRGSAPAGCVTLGRQPKLSGLLPLNPIPSLTGTVLNYVLLWEDSSVVGVLKYLSPCWSDHVTGRLSVKTVPPSPFVWLVLERSKTCHQTLSGPWEQFPGTPSCAPVEGLSQCLAGSRRGACCVPSRLLRGGWGGAGWQPPAWPTHPHASLSTEERWLEPAVLPPVERGLEKPLPNYLLKAVSPAQMV